jgi:hypothetical protein
MAGEALFLGWGPIVRGREEIGLRVFQETLEYYGRLQSEGQIDSFEPVLLAPHGGDLGGFILLRGERSRLDQIRAGDEFERLVARAGSVVDNVGVITAYTGESLGQTMARFQEASQELVG